MSRVYFLMSQRSPRLNMVRDTRPHSFPTGCEHLLKIGITLWIMVGRPSPHRLRPLLSMSRVYFLMSQRSSMLHARPCRRGEAHCQGQVCRKGQAHGFWWGYRCGLWWGTADPTHPSCCCDISSSSDATDLSRRGPRGHGRECTV